MSDVMLFGVLNMPYDLAMADDLSRVQYYGRAREAVEEIKRLRALLARYRDETPLGNQPHMIADEVDAALGRK